MLNPIRAFSPPSNPAVHHSLIGPILQAAIPPDKESNIVRQARFHTHWPSYKPLSLLIKIIIQCNMSDPTGTDHPMGNYPLTKIYCRILFLILHLPCGLMLETFYFFIEWTPLQVMRYLLDWSSHHRLVWPLHWSTGKCFSQSVQCQMDTGGCSCHTH